VRSFSRKIGLRRLCSQTVKVGGNVKLKMTWDDIMPVSEDLKKYCSKSNDTVQNALGITVKFDLVWLVAQKV